MANDETTAARRSYREDITGKHSFDELAMASGILPRSRAIKLLGATVLGGALSFLALPDEAHARRRKKKRRLLAFTASSTVDQISGNEKVVANGAKITDPNEPFTFPANLRTKIVKIEQITIRATFDNGNSAPGDFDENQLILALDGINTGIKLNGFGQDVDTRTNSGIPINQGAIINALKTDGRLAASTIDADPQVDSNSIFVLEGFQTTLTIKGKRQP